MIEKINRFLSNYKVERKRLDGKQTLKTTIITTLNAILISFIVFLIPALLIYNLYIIDQIIVLLNILIFILVISFSFFFNYIFVVLTKANNDMLQSFSFKTLVIVDSTIISIFLVILTIVVMQVMK